MAWTVNDYPFTGGAGSPIIVAGGQNGHVTSVLDDGSLETTVTFPTPFAAAPTTVIATVNTGVSAGTGPLVVTTDNVTATGFKLYVSGGAPSSTCTVGWFALP